MEKYSTGTIKQSIKGRSGTFQFPQLCHHWLVCQASVQTLEFYSKGVITTGDKISGNSLWLKSIWGLKDVSQFYFSLDGKVFTPFGNIYQLARGAYRGDRIALFNYNNLDDKAFIDVDYFQL